MTSIIIYLPNTSGAVRTKASTDDDRPALRIP